MTKINSREEARDGILEIVEELANPEHLQAFIDNMRHLKYGDEWDLFEWWTTYLAWSELSTREDMDMMYGD